jgi:hypothetical protein
VEYSCDAGEIKDCGTFPPPLFDSALKAGPATGKDNHHAGCRRGVDLEYRKGMLHPKQPGREEPSDRHQPAVKEGGMPMSAPRYELCNSVNRGSRGLRFPFEEPDEAGFVADYAFLHPPAM